MWENCRPRCISRSSKFQVNQHRTCWISSKHPNFTPAAWTDVHHGHERVLALRSAPLVSSKLITISDFWIISSVFVAYRCNTLHYHHSSSSGTNAFPWCLCENPEYLSPTELGSASSKKILINLVFVCFFFQACLCCQTKFTWKVHLQREKKTGN